MPHAIALPFPFNIRRRYIPYISFTFRIVHIYKYFTNVARLFLNKILTSWFDQFLNRIWVIVIAPIYMIFGMIWIFLLCFLAHEL